MRKFNRQQRSTARLALVQMIFSKKQDLGAVDASMIASFMDEDWAKPDAPFIKKRYESILSNLEFLETTFKNSLKDGWTFERVDTVLVAICLVATDELLFGGKDATPEILVKEYADLASDFFEKTEVGFVNAYLNDLKKKKEELL